MNVEFRREDFKNLNDSEEFYDAQDKSHPEADDENAEANYELEDFGEEQDFAEEYGYYDENGEYHYYEEEEDEEGDENAPIHFDFSEGMLGERDLVSAFNTATAGRYWCVHKFFYFMPLGFYDLKIFIAFVSQEGMTTSRRRRNITMKSSR